MLTFWKQRHGNFDEFECKKNCAENQWFTETLVIRQGDVRYLKT